MFLFQSCFSHHRSRNADDEYSYSGIYKLEDDTMYHDHHYRICREWMLFIFLYQTSSFINVPAITAVLSQRKYEYL
jgi:hypothetical protein